MAKKAMKAAKRSAKAPAKKAASKAKTSKKKVSAIPARYHSLTPYLVVKKAAAAIEFYKAAFGARVTVRMDSPDGSVMHAELKIGNSTIMLGEEFPSMGVKSAETLGGTPAGLMWYTPNVDQAFAKAIAAGAKEEQPPTDMFWGDRYGKLVDPFGHRWSIATHVEDISPKEMGRRMAEFAKQMETGKTGG